MEVCALAGIRSPARIGSAIRRRLLTLSALAWAVPSSSAITPAGAQADATLNAVIKQYNAALKTESERLLALPANPRRLPDAQQLLAFLINHDARHADLFASALLRKAKQSITSAVNARLTGRAALLMRLQQQLAGRGIVMRFTLLRDRSYLASGGPLLWRLGKPFHLDALAQAAIHKVFDPREFPMPEVRTVLTDNVRGNFFAAGQAYVAPASASLMAHQSGLQAAQVVALYALHEAAHSVDLQVFGGSEERKQAVYSLNLNEFADAIGDVVFYESDQVDEFVADAVMAQAGAPAVTLLAQRVLYTAGIVDALGRNERPVEIDPLAASAMFVLAGLLRQQPDVQVANTLRTLLRSAASDAKRQRGLTEFLGRTLTVAAAQRISADYLEAARTIQTIAHRQ